MLGKLGNQQGISLLVLVIMIVLVGIIAAGITAFLIQNLALSLSEKDRARALYLAEAGFTDSFWELKNRQKLYGLPAQPFGQIDQQTINFADGTKGTYETPEPIDSIVSIGTYKGIVRKTKAEIILVPKDYVLFSGEKRDFRFAQSCQVEGNVFVNGNVTVRRSSNIDTTKMRLYLPKGNTAQYEPGGSGFPYISLESPPALPSLDTHYYDSLLTLHQSQLPGDVVWQNTQFLNSGTILINGNLTIKAPAEISSLGFTTVVVTGWIRMLAQANGNILIKNNIKFVAKGVIEILIQRIQIGLTTGRSGNLLYSAKEVRTNDGSSANRAVINGSIVSPQSVSLGNWAIVNGFIYAGNTAQVGQQVSLNGAIWAGNFSDGITVGTTGSKVGFIWRGDYIPSPLPRGIAEIQPNVELVANSWKEIN